MTDLREIVARAINPDGFMYGVEGNLTRDQAERRMGAFIKADRVLAALRASGRLAPEVAGGVLQAAQIAAMDAFSAESKEEGWDKLDAAVAAAAPIIAAAAEAKAREECAKACEAEADRCRDYGTTLSPVLRQREFAAAATCRMLAARIRTGAAS